MLLQRAILLGVGFLLVNHALAQEMKVDVEAVRSLVSRWNEAHTFDKTEIFASLYFDNVTFYGSTLTRQQCNSIKQGALAKDDFKQTLKNGLNLTAYSSGTIRCDFVKTVTRNNVTRDYNAYLLIKQFGDKYFIVGESDLITNRRLKHTPDLGTRIAIKDVKNYVITESSKDDDIQQAERSSRSGLVFLIGSLALGVTGLVLAYKWWLQPMVEKRHTARPTPAQVAEYVEKGLAFEKFVVEQFDLYKDYFTLKEWRSDKFHNGIFPESNRYPDLVYQFKYKDFARTFSVECKYRSKVFATVRIMDDDNYRNYKTFNLNIPVYIALGLGGEPNDPAELYLIPFQNVKLEMSYRELSNYRKARKFYYNMELDRLT